MDNEILLNKETLGLYTRAGVMDDIDLFLDHYETPMFEETEMDFDTDF